MLKNEARYEDAEFRAFLRTWQWRSLFHGKAEATKSMEAERAGAWSLERAPMAMPVEG
jgi:hypothetical protein